MKQVKYWMEVNENEKVLVFGGIALVLSPVNVRSVSHQNS